MRFGGYGKLAMRRMRHWRAGDVCRPRGFVAGPLSEANPAPLSDRDSQYVGDDARNEAAAEVTTETMQRLVRGRAHFPDLMNGASETLIAPRFKLRELRTLRRLAGHVYAKSMNACRWLYRGEPPSQRSLSCADRQSGHRAIIWMRRSSSSTG